MSQKFATIFFTRLYILDFLNKKQQISVTSEMLPISSYVTDIYYLFLFELFLIITIYQVTDIYYYFELLQISVTFDLISNPKSQIFATFLILFHHYKTLVIVILKFDFESFDQIRDQKLNLVQIR